MTSGTAEIPNVNAGAQAAARSPSPPVHHSGHYTTEPLLVQADVGVLPGPNPLTDVLDQLFVKRPIRPAEPVWPLGSSRGVPTRNLVRVIRFVVDPTCYFLQES